MSSYLGVLLFTTWLTAQQAEPASCAEVTVYVGWQPVVPTASNSHKPQILDLATNTTLEPRKNGTSWEVRLSDSSRLVTPLLFEIEPTVPTGYSYAPIELAIPTVDLTFKREVRLSPYRLSPGSKVARGLIHVDVRNMAAVELPEFYQRVHAIALDRMERLNEHWDRLHVLDIQCVYKYLETVNALTTKFFLVPPPDVEHAVTWMNTARSASDETRKTIEKAVGMMRLVELLNLLEASEAVRFTHYYNVASQWPDPFGRYRFLKAYEDLLLGVPESRRSRIETGMRVPYSVVLLSRAQAFVQALRAGMEENRVSVIQTLQEFDQKLSILYTRASETDKGRIKADLERLSEFRSCLELRQGDEYKPCLFE